MAVDQGTGPRSELEDIAARLQPEAPRADAIARLDELFRGGRAPDPLPDGFHKGRLITMSLWGPSDALMGRIAHGYMPWLGKSFDPQRLEGVNVLTKKARGPMRAVWPRYAPERELADRIEAFPFKNRIAPGEVDPGLDVLKIDYNFEANPGFIIRRILDELVEIEDGLYLGKILFRRQGSWAPIGFFSLER